MNLTVPRIGVAAQVEFAQLEGQHCRVHQVVRPHREIVVESENICRAGTVNGQKNGIIQQQAQTTGRRKDFC